MGSDATPDKMILTDAGLSACLVKIDTSSTHGMVSTTVRVIPEVMKWSEIDLRTGDIIRDNIRIRSGNGGLGISG
jgi:hypothetical protein